MPENESKNKHQKALLIIAISIFAVLIIGATYTYFGVNIVSNFGTSIINADTGAISTVTLNGTDSPLILSLSAADMNVHIVLFQIMDHLVNQHTVRVILINKKRLSYDNLL